MSYMIVDSVSSFLFISFYLSPLAAGSHPKAISMHLMGTIYARDRIKNAPFGVRDTPDVFKYKVALYGVYAARVTVFLCWKRPNVNLF